MFVKRLISSLLLFSLCMSLAVEAENNTEPVKIYMTPVSDKSPLGTFDAPFTTFEQVQTYITRYKKNNKQPVEIQVLLRGGEYYIDHQIVLGANDTGYDNEHRVIYKAYGDEIPVIKGSKSVDMSKFNKVTDPKILKRLEKSAREKIGVVDLRAQGFADEKNNPWSEKYMKLYFDGKEQMISQWPNGIYNWARYKPLVKGGSGTGKGGTFTYLDTNEPSKWMSARDIYITGFWTDEYHWVTVPLSNIDPARGTIKIDNGAITLQSSRRWQAFNALEMIDVPGEWYLDRTNMLLYYYPPYGIAGKKVEVSLLDTSMFEFKGGSNVTFEGITFEQTRSDVLSGQHNQNNPIVNVSVDKCTFNNTGTSVNFYTYDFNETYDQPDASYQYPVGICKNISITNNILFNSSGSGIRVSGCGSYRDYTQSDVIIANNYSNQKTQTSLDNLLYTVNGVKPVVKNNLAHNSPQRAGGNVGWETETIYNEFGTVLRETADAGAHYVGRTMMSRRNLIAYNMFLGVNPDSPYLEGHEYGRGIYFDDGFAGGIVHHNIIYDGQMATSTSGCSSKYWSNTTVDCLNSIEVGTSSYMKKLYPNFYSMPSTAKVIERYPEIEDEYKKLLENNYSASVNNEVVNNYIVNGRDPQTAKSATTLQYNKIENNIVEKGYDAFVDPENLDFRVKKDSAAYKANPDLLNEDFDISKIGIQWDEGFDKDRILGRRNFRKLYPKNGAISVPTSNVEFMWEKAFDADEYRFVLATDPEFNNIVEDKIVPYNYCTVNNLNADFTDYYWKVYARNLTVAMRGEWESNGVVYRFTTTKYEFLDFSELENAIEKINKEKAFIKEGTEGGSFREGTLIRVNEALKKAEEAVSWKSGERRQYEIDEITKELLNAYSDNDIISGYYDLGKDFDNPSKWQIRDPENANIKFNGGQVSMDTLTADGTSLGNTFMECEEFTVFSKKILFAFSMKAEFRGKTPWVGFGIRGQLPMTDLWSVDNYFFVIKPDIIEVQLRSPGKTGILETFPNECIKEGQWHDIIFGAYDCEFGQMMVLYVDGKLIKRFMDSDPDQIAQKGMLKIYMSAPGKLELRGIQKWPEQDFDEMVIQSIREESLSLAQNLEKYCGEKAVVFVDGTNIYYDNTLKEYNSVVYEFVDENEMINAALIKDIFGYDTVFENDSVTVNVNGMGVTFRNGVNTIDYSGTQMIMNTAPYLKDGNLFVPLTTIVEFVGKTVAQYDGVASVTVRNPELINNKNAVNAVKGAFKKLMEVTDK